MGTNLTYNGVRMVNVVTREFDQTPVRDHSDTDTIHHRFLIHVETILNPSLLLEADPRLGFEIPGFGGGTLSSAASLIHRLLSQDRGHLVYDFDGFTVLDVEPCLSGSPNADANNGPRVVTVKLTQISPATVHVLFGVEAALVVCGQYSAHPILNNRWASTDDIDENWKTTRRWVGKLRMRTAALSAHDFRSIVIPPLPKGWRRKGMHFTGEANALELGYEITDEEITGQAVPSPATSMDCRHSENLSFDGAKIEGHLSIRLDGVRGSDKKKMWVRCQQIAMAKLQWDATTTNVIQSYEMIDHIGPHVNAVEINATVVKTNKSPNNNGALDASEWGKVYVWPVAYDIDRSFAPGPHGTASAVGLLACYLQSPCAIDHSFPKTDKQTPPKVPLESTLGEPPTHYTYTEGPIGDQIPPVKYSTFQQQAIYTYLRIESHILMTENRVQLPIAKQSPATGDTAATIRLAPATAKRMIRIAAERVGQHVQLYTPKDFESGGFKHKLLTWHPNQRPPVVGGDNKNRFSADAEYIYSLNRAPGPEDAIPIPSMFWDESAAPNNAFNTQHYLDPAGNKGLG